MAGLSAHIRNILKDPANAPLTPEKEAELADIITAARQAREANALTPRLERSEKKAREELVRRSIRLVVTIAQSYRHRVDMDDLVGAGNVALVRAVNVWNPQVGPLAPWAIRWVRSAMTRLVDSSRTIRLPEELAYKGAILARTRAQLESELGREPTLTELADAVGATEEDVQRLESAPEALTILDAPRRTTLDEGPGMTLLSTLTSEDCVEDEVTAQDTKRRLIEACSELTTVEARIIIARFDLADTGERPTLSELGEQLGFSREMVRKLEASALAKLRHPALKVELENLDD